MDIKIAPSILSADFGRLNEDIATISAYADIVHVDVMDGHFVGNLTFGAPVMKWIKSNLPLNVHLMIEKPWKYLKDFVDAGANMVIVHAEACGRGKAYDFKWGNEDNLAKVLNDIKELGIECGVSIRPNTPVSEIVDVLDFVDEVLVMSVEPGFGGQKFMESALDKIENLRALGFAGYIAVDGGVNEETAKWCRDRGANVLIAGSYIFKADDREEAVGFLRGES